MPNSKIIKQGSRSGQTSANHADTAPQLAGNLPDPELLQRMKDLVNSERQVQADFLQHLLEVDDRKLFLRIGHGSLFDYVTKELGYSESAGYRRIQAMRLLRSVPQLNYKILEGRVNLTSVAQVQSFIKAEEKRGITVSNLDKAEILAVVEQKSTREVEKYLLSLQPEGVIPEERVRQITVDHVELRMAISDELKADLDKLKLLLSHVNPDMGYADLLAYLTKKALAQFEKPTVKTPVKFKRKATPAPEVNPQDSDHLAITKDHEPNSNEKNERSSTPLTYATKNRYIPAKTPRKIWQRDNSCCSFVDIKTKKKCGSKYQVQIDHIKPFALGGTHDEENLRLLCANHNRLRSEVSFRNSEYPRNGGLKKRPDGQP